jgi:hypothetical protein
MSHWHRLPRAVSVKYLLQRSKRDFILDEALFPYQDMFRSLSQNIFLIHDVCAEGSTAMQVSAACQNRQSILATANPEFVNQLNSGPPNSWGLLLVPESEKAREDVLNSLFSGLLTLRPSTERTITVEHAPFSTLFFDLRQIPPVVGIFYRCQQSRRPGKS